MDKFANSIDSQKFQETNAHWNDLCLNDPWSVGYVSTLIDTVSFNSKEQWEDYYYQTGVKRNEIILKKFANDIALLNNHVLKRTNPSRIQELSWDIKNVNLQFGRTKKQIAEKGKILYDYVTAKGIIISLKECIECVRFRTICETWNGIIIRERNTIQKLIEALGNIKFHKTTGDFDHNYAVDYELKAAGKLICGIQIKPKSYTYDRPYLNKARNANKTKNAKYKNEFGKDVFDVVSQSDGVIINKEVLGEVKILIEST